MPLFPQPLEYSLKHVADMLCQGAFRGANVRAASAFDAEIDAVFFYPRHSLVGVFYFQRVAEGCGIERVGAGLNTPSAMYAGRCFFVCRILF